MINKLKSPTNKLKLLRNKIGIETISDMCEKKTNKYKELNVFTYIKTGEVLKYTYSEVYDQVKKIAAYLSDLGLKKGDHIAIISENRPEWAISYFAVLWLGCIAIPLDAKTSFDSLKHIISFSESKAVIFSADHLTNITSIKEYPNELKHLIPMEQFNVIAGKYSSGIDRVDVSGNDLSEILFTSGTTGNPKGVMLTHKNIISNVEDIYSFLDINPGDRAFSILPIHHSYEKTGGLLSTFYSGISIYYGRGLKPRELIEDLKYVKPTIWINTPLLLEKLILRINKELDSQKGIKKYFIKFLPKSLLAKSIKNKLGLNDIRLLVSGGAGLPEWVFDGFKNLGITIIEGYGMSETSPLISANPVSKERKGSVGLVIDSDDVEIRDLDDEKNGEILVKGPNVMQGYFKNEEETNSIFTTDGWLKTGDIGYFDEDGYLYITGRKKFIIVTRGGKNIFPEELEEKLTKIPLIEEALVFSPDDKEIQTILFPSIDEYRIVSNKDHVDYKDEELYNILEKEIKILNRQLEPYKRISKFAVKLDEFPKTTTRKIKRFHFKDLDLNNANTYI